MRISEQVYRSLFIRGCFVFSFLTPCPAGPPEKAAIPLLRQDAAALVERLAAKRESDPKYTNWAYRSVSINREMTKKWVPEKTTVVEKKVRVIDKDIVEEILKAEETKNGKTRDVTQAKIKESAERRKKAEKERARAAKNKSTEKDNKQGTFSVSLEDVFPFKEEKRKDFDFSSLDDSEIDGRPVFVLQSSAKVKNPDTMEGLYYIDKDSLSVLKISIRPSKMPKMVKVFDIDMGFETLPSGHFIVKNLQMKINGGMFLKHIRMEIEEVYSDHEILN